MRGLSTGILIGAVLTSAACTEPDDFETGGGDTSGGDTSGGGDDDGGDGPVVDGGPGADAGEAVISGKVCQIDDVRQPGGCSTSRSGMVRLVETGLTYVTDANGNFVLPAEPDEERVTLVFTADEPTLTLGAVHVPLAGDGSVDSVKLRVISRARLDELLAANLQGDQPGLGQLVVLVRDADGQPVTNATLGPTQGAEPWYDQGESTSFVPLGTTGVYGFAMYFNLSETGSTTFTVDVGGEVKQYETPVVADALNVVTVVY